MYDDNFETITSTNEEPPGAWKYILQFNRERVFDDDDETRTSKKKEDQSPKIKEVNHPTIKRSSTEGGIYKEAPTE